MGRGEACSSVHGAHRRRVLGWPRVRVEGGAWAMRDRAHVLPGRFRTLGGDEGGLGGQATSSPLIRNYLGFPRGVSGRRLAQQAYEQAWVFGAKFAFMQKVTDLRRDSEGLFLTLSDGADVRAAA